MSQSEIITPGFRRPEQYCLWMPFLVADQIEDDKFARPIVTYEHEPAPVMEPGPEYVEPECFGPASPPDSEPEYPDAQVGGPFMLLYNRRPVEHELRNFASMQGDKTERDARKALFQRILRSGEERVLAVIDPETYQQELDDMERYFGNFSEVIAYLRGVCAIAAADDLTPQPDPILLNGPPGIGKTLFAQRVAGLFGLRDQMHIVHTETMQTNADLIGSSRMWSNTQTGQIFDALVFGRYGNALFLLDEIDKAASDPRFSVGDALLSLLADTSKRFCDASEPWMEINASRILYIATANDSSALKPALKSRLMQFEIAPPTREQSCSIIHNIFTVLQCERSGAYGGMWLSEGAVESLLEITPRKIKAALKSAAGNAIIDNRGAIRAEDVAVEKPKKSIGFR